MREPGDTVVHTAGSYPTFRHFAEGVGAQPREVPHQAMPAACARTGKRWWRRPMPNRRRCSTWANPDNPTGHLVGRGVVAQLRAALNPDTLLLLDEPYLDFAEPTERPADGPLPGVLRLRTFVQGLCAGRRAGGLRLG